MVAMASPDAEVVAGGNDDRSSHSSPSCRSARSRPPRYGADSRGATRRARRTPGKPPSARAAGRRAGRTRGTLGKPAWDGCGHRDGGPASRGPLRGPASGWPRARALGRRRVTAIERAGRPQRRRRPPRADHDASPEATSKPNETRRSRASGRPCPATSRPTGTSPYDGRAAGERRPRRGGARHDCSVRQAGCHRIVHTIGSAALVRFEGTSPRHSRRAGRLAGPATPRHPRAGVPRSRTARRERPVKAASLLTTRTSEATAFLLLPVRPRARARPDDLLGPRPSLGSRDGATTSRPNGTISPAPAGSSWRTSRRPTASSRGTSRTTTRSTRAG